jgi:hypothetical protein
MLLKAEKLKSYSDIIDIIPAATVIVLFSTIFSFLSCLLVTLPRKIFNLHGVTFREIDDSVEKAMYARSTIQHNIENKKSHCQKCGEWLEGNSVSDQCGEISI